MWYVLALLFAVSFLPQGLFYRHEYLPAVALLALWLLWRAIRQRSALSWRVYLGPSLMLLGYLLSLFDAIRPADTLMAIAELAVLFGLMGAAATEKDPRAGLRGIAAAALVAAGYALLVFGGFLHDPAAYTPPFLTGSIQYHNAFGAAMALGLMVLAALAGAESRRLVQAIMSAVGVPLAVGLYLSLSRGVYVLFPLALIVLLLVQGISGRRRIMAMALPSLVLGAILIAPVHAAAGQHSVILFLWLLAAMLVAGGASLVLQRLPQVLFGRRAVQVYGVILFVLVLAVGAFARSRVLHLLARLLPAGVGIRFTQISLHSATLFDRLIMDGIALKIIAGHAWIGYGANAWQDLYHRYQSSFFIANETHSYLTQVFLEGGVLAGIGLIWLLYLLLRRLWTAGEGEERSLRVGASAAGLFLLLHSFMDFDLSYFSFLAMFFFLTGTAAGGEERDGARAWQLPIGSLLYPLAALGLVLAIPLGLGEKSYADGMTAMARGHFSIAQRDVQQAARWDPLDGRTFLAEGQIQANSSPLQAMTALGHAEALLPDDTNVLLAVMQTGVASGEYQAAAKAARAELVLEPLRADTYWYGAQILPEAVLHEMAHGKVLQGAPDLSALRNLIRDYRRAGPGSLYVDLRTMPLPQDLTAMMDEATGDQDVLTERLRAAEPLLVAARQDDGLRPHADIWLYAVAAKLRDEHQLQLLSDQPWVLWRNVNPDFVDLQEILAKE